MISHPKLFNLRTTGATSVARTQQPWREPKHGATYRYSCSRHLIPKYDLLHPPRQVSGVHPTHFRRTPGTFIRLGALCSPGSQPASAESK
eukprot:3936776-Rhodomonas_salina.1